MITVDEALILVESNCSALPVKAIALADSVGLVLAEEIISPINMPPFRQSAMDGYALNFSEEINSYKVIGEIAAGSSQKFELKPGEAIRIFTGGSVPDSANSIIQQELITKNDNSIQLNSPFSINQNIRKIGEQIKKGEIALKKNIKLTPAAVGYIASLGIAEIKVIPNPKIALLNTGNELTEPGKNLEDGKIFESNSLMLDAALKSFHFYNLIKEKVIDQLAETISSLKKLISENDIVLVSGGISVGDYDYVKKALESLGVKEIFYKVKQKPGKPLFFGTVNNKLIFALPGNPAAALTCFYIYVLPALRKLSGNNFAGLKKSQLKLATDFSKKTGLAHFLKSISTNDSVTILEGQSSAMLQTFALANSIVYIPESVENLKSGDRVDVYLFD